MRRTKTYTPLRVFMNDKAVGVLPKSPCGETSFSYGREWVNWEGAMPISLSLPLQERSLRGAAVIGFFDNLLPGSSAMLKNIAERVGAAGMDAFSLLSAIGADCVGALQFIPNDDEAEIEAEGSYEPLSRDQVRDVLQDLKHTPLGIKPDGDIRISLAGAQ